MRFLPAGLLLLCAACVPHPPTVVPVDNVHDEVAAFARTVAEGVSKDGVAAWQTWFPSAPSFFMAVDGHLEFQDGADAGAKIPGLARSIKSIQLEWRDPMRIDPLTHDFAVFAAPWHESITLADGNRTDTSGYFSAVLEKRD